MSTRAAIYLRVSLDQTGEQLAVSRQREDCRRIAEQRGWEVVKEYVDNSISASDAKKNRPAYNQMVEDYADSHFDALVCWDLDRLTRQPRQLEDWVEAAEHRGLLLVTASGEADLTTDNGRLFARIKAAVARAEVERKGARQTRALRQRAEMGRMALGTRLTGYEKDGTIVPAEARIVRQMFEDFLNGRSLKEMSKALDASGMPPRRGERWHPSTLREIMLNPRYAGLQVYKGEVIGKGNWKPIVDEETFRLAESKLRDPNRKTQNGTARKYLLAGIATCGVCGNKVRTFSGERYSCRLICFTRRQPDIDAHVEGVVAAYLARKDVRERLVAARTRRENPLVVKQGQLMKRLQTVNNDYDLGLIDGLRLKAATDRINEELATIDRQLARQLHGHALSGVLTSDDPAQAFLAGDLETRRAVVDALVSVTIYAGRRGRKTYDPDLCRIEPRVA